MTAEHKIAENVLIPRMLDTVFRMRIMALLAAIAGYHFFMPFNVFYYDCVIAGTVAYVLFIMLQPTVPQSLAGKKEPPPTPPQTTLAKPGSGLCKQKQTAHADGCGTTEGVETRAVQKALAQAAGRDLKNTDVDSINTGVTAQSKRKEALVSDITPPAPIGVLKPTCQQKAQQEDAWFDANNAPIQAAGPREPVSLAKQPMSDSAEELPPGRWRNRKVRRRGKRPGESKEPEAAITAEPQEAVVEKVMQIAKPEIEVTKVVKMLKEMDTKVLDAPLKLQLLSEASKAHPTLETRPAPGLSIERPCQNDASNLLLAGKQPTPLVLKLSETIKAPLLSDPIPDQPVLKSPKENSPPEKPLCTPLECEIQKLEEKLRESQRFQEQMQHGKGLENKKQEKLMKSEDFDRRIAELRFLQCVAEEPEETGLLPIQLMNEALSFLDGPSGMEGVFKHFGDIGFTKETPGFEALWQYLPPAPPPGLEPNFETEFNAACDHNLPIGLEVPRKRTAKLNRKEGMCWCWINQGWCPRAEHCPWKHPPLRCASLGHPLFFEGMCANK